MHACETTSTQVPAHQEIDSNKVIADSITTDYRMFQPITLCQMSTVNISSFD